MMWTLPAPPRARVLSFPALILTAALGACGGSEPPPELTTTGAALTAEQCTWFAIDDKVTICHRTKSAKNPYVVIRTSSAGCASGHAGHSEDYVSTTDPTCREKGCYPEGAPVSVEDVVPCCGGAPIDGVCPPVDACASEPCPAGQVCTDLPHPAAGDVHGRICKDLCASVECAAPDACHASACDWQTGACVVTALSGTGCDDGDACTEADACKDGTCGGSPIAGCGEPERATCSLTVTSPSVATTGEDLVADFDMRVADHASLTFDAALQVDVGLESVGGKIEGNLAFADVDARPDTDGVIKVHLSRALGSIPELGGVYVVSAYARTQVTDGAGRRVGLHCFTNETSLQVIATSSK
ncbi:MAG: hypothetical protein IT385_15375 [Deltaproteobacteria bacterium]|nr:hypothetical protein [Deltaproteobacteria bacterium]